MIVGKDDVTLGIPGQPRHRARFPMLRPRIPIFGASMGGGARAKHRLGRRILEMKPAASIPPGAAGFDEQVERRSSGQRLIPFGTKTSTVASARP